MLPTVDNLGLRKKSVCQVQSVLWNSKRVAGTNRSAVCVYSVASPPQYCKQGVGSISSHLGLL